MPEDVPLGTLLRRHRRAAGMTLEEAAETSGVSARAISDMERGRTRGPAAAHAAIPSRRIGRHAAGS